LSIGYLGGQVSMRVPLSVVMALFFYRTIIFQGKCVRQVVVDSHGRYQNGTMSLSKLSRFTFCLQIQERTRIIFFFLPAGESCVIYPFSRFTFSGVSRIPFFRHLLCFAQLYNRILHLGELSFEPRHVFFTTLCC